MRTSRLLLAPLAALVAGAAFSAGGCSLSRMGISAMERAITRQGFTEQVYADDEFTVRYWVGGSGPPLLLIHGFGGDGLGTWRGQLEAFAEHYTVIVPDLLWFGGSSGGTPGLDAQGRAQIALLDHLSIPKADVVNVSYGGFVTLSLLYLAPERVGRVVFQDSPGPAFSESDVTELVARFGAESPEDIFVPTSGEDVGVLLDLTFYDDPRVPGFILNDLHRNVFSINQEEQRALLADLVGNRALGEALDLSQLKPLVVWGRYDEVFPLESGRALADMTGGELVVIEEAAHGPSAEHPEAFNAAVLEYLGQTRKPTR